MKRAAVPSILVVVILLAVGVTAGAQQPKNIPRIGFLVASSPSYYANRIEIFRQGLRELGYVEGKNIGIDAGDVLRDLPWRRQFLTPDHHEPAHSHHFDRWMRHKEPFRVPLDCSPAEPTGATVGFSSSTNGN